MSPWNTVDLDKVNNWSAQVQRWGKYKFKTLTWGEKETLTRRNKGNQDIRHRNTGPRHGELLLQIPHQSPRRQSRQQPEWPVAQPDLPANNRDHQLEMPTSFSTCLKPAKGQETLSAAQLATSQERGQKDPRASERLFVSLYVSLVMFWVLWSLEIMKLVGHGVNSFNPKTEDTRNRGGDPGLQVLRGHMVRLCLR